MGTKIKNIILTLLFISFSFIIEINVDDILINTLYTVSGIMFSIGLGLLVTFNLNGVKNPKFIKKLRQNLNKVKNNYLTYFIASTIFYVTSNYLYKIDLQIIKFNFNSDVELSFDTSIITTCIILYSIFYYIINFIALQKLNDEVFDELNK